MTCTHTFATLEVSRNAYREIKRRIKKATGTNEHLVPTATHGVVIDMHGIALCIKPRPIRRKRV